MNVTSGDICTAIQFTLHEFCNQVIFIVGRSFVIFSKLVCKKQIVANALICLNELSTTLICSTMFKKTNCLPIPRFLIYKLIKDKYNSRRK